MTFRLLLKPFFFTIIVFLMLSTNIQSKDLIGPQIFMHGGWNNYDLRGVGWTTYTQIGIEKYPSNFKGFGYGTSLLFEKTDQQEDILGYHYPLSQVKMSGHS